MKKLLRVIAGEALDVPPVWLMRQAGRYLPEYRETRNRRARSWTSAITPSWPKRSRCNHPPLRLRRGDLVCGYSAYSSGAWHGPSIRRGRGPRMDWPKGTPDLGALKPVDEIDETVGPVYETVARLSKSLPEETTLIGFAGAPWTVATYMVAGRGTPDQAPARRWMYEDTQGFSDLIDLVTEATIHYLSKQIERGPRWSRSSRQLGLDADSRDVRTL